MRQSNSFRSQSASGARPRLDVPSGVLATADQVINRTRFVALRYVCFWRKADIPRLSSNVCFWGKADIVPSCSLAPFGHAERVDRFGFDYECNNLGFDPMPQFQCPNCTAKYEIVRVEAPPGPTIDREIVCIACGGPLHGREGKFLMKYFLVERPRRRA